MKGARPARASHVECVDDIRKAATLLHPLRLEIVRAAAEPVSASAVADRLGLPRQRVNYHVRELAKSGFLVPAGTRRRRNLIERLYLATARAYVLEAGVLGPAAEAGSANESGGGGAAHLVAVAARTQEEVARSSRAASERGLELPALTLDAEIRFETPAQRAAFAESLAAALARVIRDHTSPERTADGERAPGRAHRLVVFCHARPEDEDASVEIRGGSGT